MLFKIIKVKTNFSETQSYLESELQNNASDFQLLTNLNQATTAKYSDKKSQLDQVVITNAELSTKIEDLVSNFLSITDN